jgi:hypothetical protein
VTSAIAAALSVVAPGVRGNGGERTVEIVDRAAAVFSYAMCGMLTALLFAGAVEIARDVRLGGPARVVVVGASGMAIALAAPAIAIRIHPGSAVMLAIASMAIACAGTWYGVRAPHTRAVAVVLGLTTLAAMTRLGAWELSTAAGEQASPQLYNFSRGVATFSVLLEGFGQLVAAAWLGLRGRVEGRLASNVAIILAFVVTWGAARGSASSAPPWQAILHASLANAAGEPPPFALGAVATFLVSGGILLALVAALQRAQVVAVISALSLSLVARAAFDVPLRGLSASAAGVWLLVAMGDQRAMWRSLVLQRERRLEDERAEA